MFTPSNFLFYPHVAKKSLLSLVKTKLSIGVNLSDNACLSIHSLWPEFDWCPSLTQSQPGYMKIPFKRAVLKTMLFLKFTDYATYFKSFNRNSLQHTISSTQIRECFFFQIQL